MTLPNMLNIQMNLIYKNKFQLGILCMKKNYIVMNMNLLGILGIFHYQFLKNIRDNISGNYYILFRNKIQHYILYI